MPPVDFNTARNEISKSTYEKVLEATSFIKSQDPEPIKLGIICGSGLGRIAEALTNPLTLDYNDIPFFEKTG